MATRAGLDQHKVIQAAADLADAQGLHEVSLATLAAHLGVRTPTLYHYVDGLAGLRRQLALLACREMARRLGEAIMGQAGEEAVRALAYAYRSFVKEHPGLYAATIQAADPNGHDTELQKAQGEVVQMALRSLSSYHLQGDEAIHAVRIIRSLVHGFATIEVGGGFGLPVNLNQTFDQLLDLYLQGFSNQNKGPEK
jgi:AcrR family transcriptional regulator